ncbi:MAG: hypothetical protein ABIN89_08175, partial [Chitinophagaceae bacterium]
MQVCTLTIKNRKRHVVDKFFYLVLLYTPLISHGQGDSRSNAIVMGSYGSGRGQINTLVNLVVPAPSVLTPTSSRNFIRVWEATAPQG